MHTELRPHDYQKLALRTAPPQQDRTIGWETDQILHGAIGMAAEMHEIINVCEESCESESMVAELGDICWYAALCLHGAGYDMEDIEYHSLCNVVDFPTIDLQENISKVLDQAKRLVYYNAPLTHVFITSMRKILACVQVLADENNITIDEVMAKNINKLKLRYPDQFSEQQAVQRDLKKERQAFTE